MKTLFKILGAPFANLPFCSLAGVIVGSFSGFVVAVFELENPAMVLASQQLVAIGLLLGVTGFLLVLYFLGLLMRYGVATIFWPALANALITALLTVFFTNWLHKPALEGLVGLLIGILVGALLCWLCHARERSTYAKA
jgi:hypothetical protein